MSRLIEITTKPSGVRKATKDNQLIRTSTPRLRTKVTLRQTYISIVIPLFVALGLISGTFLHSFLEMAETDSDLWNLGNWVPMSSSAVENSPRITTTDPWSKTGYTAVYSPRSQPKRTGSLSRHHQHRPANTNYLNVRQFLEMELSRSKEVRRRLREKSGEV